MVYHFANSAFDHYFILFLYVCRLVFSFFLFISPSQSRWVRTPYQNNEFTHAGFSFWCRVCHPNWGEGRLDFPKTDPSILVGKQQPNSINKKKKEQKHFNTPEWRFIVFFQNIWWKYKHVPKEYSCQYCPQQRSDPVDVVVPP